MITADEVRIWVVSPDTAPDDAAIDALLSDEERAQAGAFRFEIDRRLYRVAHALLRCALSRCAPIAPAAWRFERREHGRPELVRGVCSVPLRFNLSHTRGLAACAVTLDRDVGVDVEDLARRIDVLEIAERFFAPPEVDALRALPPLRRLERFGQIWTLKEAYVKARGEGLARSLSQFWFDLADPARIRLRIAPRLDDDPASWQFLLARPSAAHALACAARCAPANPLQFKQETAAPGFFCAPG